MKINWKQHLKIALALVATLVTVAPAKALTRGQVAFSQDFESASSVPTSTYMYRAMSSNGTYALRTQVPSSNPSGSQVLYLTVPTTQVNELKGARIKFSAAVKAEAVGVPPAAYNGIKVMLEVTNSSGVKSYPQPMNVYGTFDWKFVQHVVTLPTNTSAIRFIVGVEKVVGVSWFDNLKIEVVTPLRVRPTTPATGTMYNSHPAVPRLRGAMYNPSSVTDPANAQVLGTQWNANVARFQLNGYAPANDTEAGDLTAYNIWINGMLAKLDTFLPQAQANGMYVVIDLHVPPGGSHSVLGGNRLFQDIKYQDHLVYIWTTIATRYKNNPTVWAYDIVNEPYESDEMLKASAPGAMLPGWNQLAKRVALAIRAVDTTRPIIVEAESYANPEGFDYLEPLSGVSNVVYSVHMYKPHNYTHQGVSGNPSGVAAPSLTAIVDYLKPVRDFQTDHNVPIYAGEFSVARWSPNGDTYLLNVMNTFESYGWDWTYHAFREWHGWDLEYESSTGNAHPVSNTRQTYVRQKLNLNQKPW